MDMEPETLSIHGGYPYEGDCTTARAVPLHRTTSYQFKSVAKASDLFALNELGNIYSRLGSPTADILEKRMCLLHGAPEIAAVAVSSGHAAVFNAVMNVAAMGDNIVSANNLYGGSMTLFAEILPSMGVTVTFVDPKDPANFEKAINEKTRGFFCETVSNPALDVSDLFAISTIAHRHGLPLIVDDTFTTAYLSRPIEYGVDVVVTSLTKWTGGHGTAIGGIIIDAGTFDWAGGRHPMYDEPDGSYHGLRWAHDLPEPLKPIAFIIRLRTVLLRNMGNCLSPDNCWMFLQGIETLPVRMERHCENSLAVAQYLKAHPGVEWVRYPGLPGDKMYDLNKQYLKGKGGSLVVFGVMGGKVASAKFIDSLRMVSHVANVGDAKSLCINPATTTHSQLSDEQLRAAGVPPELVRFSVGIENIKDIIADVSQALDKAATPGPAEVVGQSRENRRKPLFPKMTKVENRTYQYSVYGQIVPSGQQQLPIVAIPGWGNTKEEFGKLPFELSDVRDVLVFDNMGIGGSVDKPEDTFTLDSWAHDVMQLVDEVFSPDSKFVVLGYSMGAFLAQHLAITRPERVASMICIGGQGQRSSMVAGKADFFKHSAKTLPSDKNTLEDNDKRMRYLFF